MPSKIPLALLLIVPLAFAQRGGGGGGRAGGPGVAHGGATHAAGVVTARVANRAPYRAGGRYGVRSRFGYGLGYGWPYLSGWDYGSALPLYGDDFAGEYPEQYPAGGDYWGMPPTDGNMAPPPFASRPATSVMHEYNFGAEPAGAAAQRATFTIVLKDGSTRSAGASWVQGGKLHYLDSESRQQVLSRDSIDRDATERANEAKNLTMVLPPG